MHMNIRRSNESRQRTYEKATRPSEMKILRNVKEYTLSDRKRPKDIRAASNIHDIVRRTRQKRRQYNQHMTRMEPHRIDKIVLKQGRFIKYTNFINMCDALLTSLKLCSGVTSGDR